MPRAGMHVACSLGSEWSGADDSLLPHAVAREWGVLGGERERPRPAADCPPRVGRCMLNHSAIVRVAVHVAVQPALCGQCCTSLMRECLITALITDMVCSGVIRLCRTRWVCNTRTTWQRQMASSGALRAFVMHTCVHHCGLLAIAFSTSSMMAAVTPKHACCSTAARSSFSSPYVMSSSPSACSAGRRPQSSRPLSTVHACRHGTPCDSVPG